MPTIFIALLFVLAPLSAMAQSNPQPECATPAPTEDGWQAAAPDAVGFDPAVLCGIGPRFKEWTAADIHSVLVIRHGKLVYEQYFAGADERLGQSIGIVNYDAATMHDLRSITKSVTALVLGIEIGKGQIAGVDQPVLPQLPDYGDLRSPERDKITLRHLLTMSQGLVWNEDLPYSNPANSEIRMDYSSDPVRYALSQPVQAPPGTVYTYSGGSATIIAALLRKATGHTLDELARADLFEPLGIADFEWIHFPSGDPVAASGLRMRPRDLAKIGQLVLDHGTWNGKQVVPADWIAAATSPQINGPQLYFYGYQFWLGRSLVQGREIDWAAGVGYGGQRLFIVPALDLVVLVHAGLYSSPMQSSVPLTILNRYVLAAVKAP
ncbi:CubicO group peptidase, beta-lactamase class C family [Rhizobiales bacterium GAS191]|nr:CubicO group peptidase, beta-lactamase class C family [Rhizobiales bacterium GAS113]SED87321.1 CubicO group peptidase, beta-lactamase class C family [Rhizobiales bacterium GAS191]